VTFGNASNLNTTATFGSIGTYVLRLTASDTQFSASDDVTVNVLTNQPPNVDAGLRQTIKLPDVVNLDGTVSDDGIPAGAALTVTWSKVSGPGAVTFGNAGAVDTTATFSSIGYYVLRLTASDSLQSSHGDVTIKVLSADATPPGGVFVTGHDPDHHAQDHDEHGVHAQHIIQRAVEYATHNKSNPRMLLVTDLRDPGVVGVCDFRDSRLGLRDAGFTFDVADFGSGGQGALNLRQVNFGNYDVVVVASDFGGWLRQAELDILNERRDEIINFVNNGGGLVAFSESGQCGLISHDSFAFLPFLVSQRVQPQNEASIRVTAAGRALGLTDEDVSANFSHSIFTANGGMDIIDTDGAGNIISLALRGKHVSAGGFANDAPIVSAGPDQTLNLPNNTVTLNGLVSDDGEPQGSPLTIQWSKVGGPGGVTFGSPGQATSSATFGAPGTYVLQLQAGDTQLTGSDTVVVNVLTDNQAPSVNAGPDQTVAFGDTATLGGTATDDGLPAGSSLSVSWTKVSGPGTVTFADAGQPSTTATFGAGGRYVLRLAANDSHLTGSDDLTVTVNEAPAVNAGPDQTASCTGVVTLDGTGSSDVDDPSSSLVYVWKEGSTVIATGPNPTVVLPVGVHTITLTVTDPHGASSQDTVVITVVDDSLPVITLTNQSYSLWPPNHQYVNFNIGNFVASASDACDPTVDINDVVITKVTSDEKENGNGDGNTFNDIIIAANCKSVQLRSERDGSSNGRVYTIFFSVRDTAGNTTTASTKVIVPKNNNGNAVDDGPKYTVTSNCP
jgi:hypothetical protein